MQVIKSHSEDQFSEYLQMQTSDATPYNGAAVFRADGKLLLSTAPLTRNEVADLIQHLKAFVDTGSLEIEQRPF